MRDIEKGPTYPYIIIQVGLKTRDNPLPFQVTHAITGRIYEIAAKYEGAEQGAKYWKERDMKKGKNPYAR